MTAAGKHRDELATAAERYGKHSRAHAGGLSVPALLRRVVARGEALRLAWSDAETNIVVDEHQEFPTAVLPVVRTTVEYDKDETTEPTTATREARKWFGPGGVVRWPLAG